MESAFAVEMMPYAAELAPRRPLPSRGGRVTGRSLHNLINVMGWAAPAQIEVSHPRKLS